MDTGNSQVYDENLNQEKIIDENIDESLNEKNNIGDNDNSENNENNILSQSLAFTTGSNFSSNKSDNLNESNLYQNENKCTKMVDIDESEPVFKQLNNAKNENINEESQLKELKQNLYSDSFGSNSKIARSNHELYMNIVQKRYQLGDSSREKKHHAPITEEIFNPKTEEEYQNDISSTSKESIHYHSQDPSENFGKKEKIKYIESNMIDDAPISISGMTYDELKKKSDRWLNPAYLNNEKYKKNHEVDMNNLSVQILAQEFLINENVDLETRAYLLESVFPLLCVSIEKLLVEIDRRKIIEMDEKPSEFIVERSHNAIPKDVPFDSINWLAQYLYRNNPKYSNYSDITSTPYLKSIKSVTTTLQAKLFEMNINQKALERADELARKREEERQQKIMEALYIEKKRTYTNLLKTLYKQWVKKTLEKRKQSLFNEF